MTPVDMDRLRAQAVSLDGFERQPAAQRFEQALERRHEGGGGQGGRGGGGGDEPPPRRSARHRGQAASPLSAQVVGWFRQSLEGELPDAPSDSRLLDTLLHDIADGVHAGRRLPGERWRLTVRLRPDVLPLTEADIACIGGELSVALRTASEDAYRALVAALPSLNAALEQRRFGHPRTTVFLISPEELQ